MVKLVYCIRRKRGLTREEFSRYWAEVHGPIGARIPGLRKLVQSHGLESFRERLRAALPNVRVVGPFVMPVGFSEVYQLYVSAQARGSGVAAVLMADAEARLAEEGFESAWLACAIGGHKFSLAAGR